MATYTVTDNVRTNYDKRFNFKFRHRSRDGHPVAQAEVNRRRAANLPAVLWRWDWPNRPLLVARYNA